MNCLTGEEARWTPDHGNYLKTEFLTLIHNSHSYAFHSLLPVQFPVPVRMISSSQFGCLGGGKGQELLLLLGQHSREEFRLRIPSVRKANESNGICLKTLPLSWINSVLSPSPLRPKECHLLIIQAKKKPRVSILAAPVLPQLKITKVLWKIPNPVLRVQQVTATEMTSEKWP